MSYRLAFVLGALGAVVFLLSGCGDSGPIPPPAAHRTPPEAYGCAVGDPIDNCKWEFPARGGTVTVEAVRREWGLSVTVKDEVNGCRMSDGWTPNPAIGGSATSCTDSSRSHCCITKGTVLEAVSGEQGVRIRYEDGKFVRVQYP